MCGSLGWILASIYAAFHDDFLSATLQGDLLTPLPILQKGSDHRGCIILPLTLMCYSKQASCHPASGYKIYS